MSPFSANARPLGSVPVVNEQRQLLGRVTFDDVIDVVEAETTEDLLRFGGVSADEDLGAGWESAVRSRLPWLSVNLLTAFLAGGVVYLFQHTIQHTVALAVLMPIVAAMGGNAGVQVITVTVRALATRDITPQSNLMRIVGKELIVEDQQEHIEFDSFFANVMFHEVAHGLGVKNTINRRGTVRDALKEQAGVVQAA